MRNLKDLENNLSENPQILNFLKTKIKINILTTTINYFLKNKIMKNEYFYLLRIIIRKFDLENIYYFNPIINLLKSFKNDLIENNNLFFLLWNGQIIDIFNEAMMSDYRKILEKEENRCKIDFENFSEFN